MELHWQSLWSLPWILNQVFVTAALLSSFPEIISYSFIWNVFLSVLILTSSLCYFLCVRWVVFIFWNWRRCPIRRSSTLASVTRAILCGLHLQFWFCGASYCGCTDKVGCFSVSLAAMLCLMQWLSVSGRVGSPSSAIGSLACGGLRLVPACSRQGQVPTHMP